MAASIVVTAGAGLSDELPLYLAYAKGGCCLCFGGFAIVAASGEESWLAGLLEEVPAGTARSHELAGLAVPTIELEHEHRRSCARYCFSRSMSPSLGCTCSHTNDLEVSLLGDGSGVFPREIHTPSVSTPLSMALIPKGTSGARLRHDRWLICLWIVDSDFSFAASLPSLRNLL